MTFHTRRAPSRAPPALRATRRTRRRGPPASPARGRAPRTPSACRAASWSLPRARSPWSHRPAGLPRTSKRPSSRPAETSSMAIGPGLPGSRTPAPPRFESMRAARSMASPTGTCPVTSARPVASDIGRPSLNSRRASAHRAPSAAWSVAIRVVLPIVTSTVPSASSSKRPPRDSAISRMAISVGEIPSR